MITGELKSKVDRIWDTMWSGGVSNPLPDSADHLSAYIRRRAGVTMQLHRALLLRLWSLLNNPIDLRSEPRCEQPT